MVSRRVVLALALLLLVVGCGRLTDRAAGGADDGGGGGGFDGQWRLTSGAAGGEIPVPDQVTLDIEGQKIRGTAACNGYSGTARIDGGDFAVDQVQSTAMGCPGKRSVAEERYMRALHTATTIERDGDTLRITGPSVELMFEAVQPPPPASFEDTAWQLDTLYWGKGPDGTASSTEADATLTFAADGSLTGTTGCMDVAGKWQRDGDVVTVTDLPLVEADCQVAGDQNDHLMKILRAPFTAEVSERSLELRQVDGDLGAGYTAP